MKISTKVLLLWLLLVSAVTGLKTQIGINTDNAAPDSSAILDLKSSRQGFLYPRMTTVERDAILGPATGLTIFNLDDQCTDIYDGTNWMKDCPLRRLADSAEIISWRQKTNFPGPARQGAFSFSINGKGYVGGGYGGPNATSFTDFWEYDPTLDEWNQLADFPGPTRSYGLGFGINGKGYVATGSSFNIDFFNDMWEYDPTTDTWTQKASLPSVGRVSVGFTIDGKAYIGPGRIDEINNVTQELWAYDPSTDTWMSKAPFPVPAVQKQLPTAFSINGKGYIGAGIGSQATAFYEYDPITNIWSQKANFLVGDKQIGVGFSINGKGYIGAGISPFQSQKDFYEFDPDLNEWKRIDDLLGPPRFGSATFTINDV
ncbi:MAG: kelch repeat-containing protein, partial [Bacteroidota bacterium]